MFQRVGIVFVVFYVCTTTADDDDDDVAYRKNIDN